MGHNSTAGADQSFQPIRWRVVLLPPLLLAATCVVLQQGGGDFWLADRLYHWQGDSWQARNAWWSSSLLHTGGRWLVILSWLLVVAGWCASRTRTIKPRWGSGLGYLAVSVLASILILTIWKRFSGVDCPWDLLRYGGTRFYLPPFSGAHAGTPPGTCFPAAHAGIAYAWVALWFAPTCIRPRWRWLALTMTLLLGAAFGVVQQLRGAHFLSHDLWSLALCWLVAASLARIRPWAGPLSRVAHVKSVGTAPGHAQ